MTPRDEQISWPDGTRMAAFFSFDLDGESWLLAADPRNAERAVTISQAQYGPQVGLFNIVRLLDEYEVPATFFVPSWTAERYPAAIEAILEGGHEIGLHGHLHERPDLLEAERERELTARSAETLERLTGRKPIGYRAPGWEASTSTTTILAELGVHYSSTFMDAIRPYFHRPDGLPEVLELPVHWVCDDWGFSMVSPYALPDPHINPIASNELVLALWSAEFDELVALGGLFTLVCHPQVTGRPYRLPTLRSMLAKAHSTPGVWIGRGDEIDAYWRAAARQECEPAGSGTS